MKPKKTVTNQAKEEIEKKTETSSEKSVNLAIKEIQQKYGDGSIMKLGEARKVDVDVITALCSW